MAINVTQVESDATQAVLDALLELYKSQEVDADSMRGFAEAVAQAAVTAVQHVIDSAETEVSGESIV